MKDMTDRTPEPAVPHRWRAWGAGAAAAVLVAGTVGGVAWWQGDDRPGLGISRTVDGDLPQPDEGWRYESYRDIVVQVPASWGYGWAPGTDWCADRGDRPAPFPTEPFVDLRGANSGTLSILCHPTPDEIPLGLEAPERLWTTHLSLGWPAGDVPDGVTEHGGWTRIISTVGHARFTVLADQEHLETARQIVDSARVVEADHNGCAAASPIQDGLFPRPQPAFDLVSVGSVDEIAVCQYDVRGPSGQPGLLASRLMSGDAANAELGALQYTSLGSGPNSPDTCLPAEARDTAIVLRLDPFTEPRDIYVYYDACVNNGFDDGTNLRQLTEENCARLWGERVVHWSGSSVPYQRCDPDL